MKQNTKSYLRSHRNRYLSASCRQMLRSRQLSILLFLLLFTLMAQAQTNTWVGSLAGSWGTSSNWSLNQVPTSAHDVVIPTNTFLFISSDSECKSMTLEGGSQDISIVFSSTYNLVVTDTVKILSGINIGSAGDDRSIAVNAGHLSCGTLYMEGTTHDAIENKITITSGTMTVAGNIVMNSSAPRNVIAFSAAGLLEVGGSISGGGITPSTSTVSFNGTSAQTATNYDYYNLAFANGGLKTLGEDVTVTGNILIENGATLSLGDWDLTIVVNANRSATINGTLQIDGDGLLGEMQGSIKTLAMGPTGYISITDLGGSTLPVFDVYSFDVLSTVDYGSTDGQTIENAAVYGILKTSGTNTKSVEGTGATLTVNGDLIIGSSTTFASSNSTIQLGGDWVNDGNFTEGTGTVVCNGSVPQEIGGSNATVFANFTINNSGGGVQLLSDVTVGSTLTLTNGLIVTDASTLIVSQTSTSAISGGSGSSYICGNLQRAIAAGANTYPYPIGSATTYAPVSLAFLSGTSAGALTAATYDGDHPSIGSSVLYEPSSVNRYWIFAPQSGFGSVSYNATFNWDAADEDASFDYLTSQVGNYQFPSWNYPAIGTRTTSSVEITSVSGFGDFQVSSCSNPTISDQPDAQTICYQTQAQFSVVADGPGDIFYQWYLTGFGPLSDGGSISGATSATLTISNAVPANNGDYYVIVTRECGAETTSDPATLTVLEEILYGMVASGDETLCSAADPANISLETAPSGGSGIFTYQWYYQDGLVSCPGGGNTSGWTIIGSATNASYDPPSGLTVSRTYALLVDPAGAPDCGPALWANGCRQITINDVDAGALTSDQTICSGGDPDAFSITIPASGSGSLSYRWQSSTTDCASDFTDISGATNATYDVPAGLTDTTYYRRIVTSTLNGVECTAMNSCLTILINNISAGSVGTDQTICSGGDPELLTVTLAAMGSGTLSYQWESSTTDCSTGFNAISGATNDTYDPPSGLADTTYYRRVVTSTLNGVPCTATSNCITVLINDVSAGSIESDQTICSGGDPEAFTVVSSATGSGVLSYQWQSSTTDCSSGFTDISGATDATYDPPSGLTDTTYYRRVVTSTLNSIACSATSNCVTVLINNVDAGLAGSDQTICSGGDPEAFTNVTAPTGSGILTYQWQSSTTDCVSDFVDIAGATDALYDVPSGLTDTTYYRRIVTSTLNSVACSAIGNCITILINNIEAGSIGSDQTICSGGDPAELTVQGVASGSGTLSYQWQSSTTDCFTGFADIGGATDATYDPPSGLIDTTYYRRVVTSTLNAVNCDAISNCVTVLINDVDAGIVSGDQTLCSGGDPEVFSVSVPATGSGDITYQWQSSTTDCINGFADIGGATDATYDPPSGLTDTTYFRRVITSTLNAVECSAISNCITVLINTIQAGSIGSDQTICPGGDPEVFSVSVPASGSGILTYQWQSSTTDCVSAFADISGATDATYDAPTGLTDTTYYRRIVTSTLNSVACSATSNCITVLINNVTAGIVGTDQTICSGGDPDIFTVNVPATGSGTLTYQWQSSTTDCISGFADISGATNATYDAPAGLTDTTYYRRIVTSTLNSAECSAISNCITVLINNVDGGSIDTDQTICSGGDPAVFTVNTPASGSGTLTYQWQSSTTDCTNGFIDIGGATEATYDAPSGLTDTTYYRRIVTSTLNSISCSAPSNCVTVLINNISAGTIGSDQTICSGGDPEVFSVLTPAEGSGALTYQWQSSTTDCTNDFTDIGGATDATYDAPSGLTDTTYYRRVVTSTLNSVACNAVSNCITVLINNVTAGTVGSDQTICSGGDPEIFTIVAPATGSGALSYQWQSSTSDCSSGFTDISGATDATYDTPPGLTDTTYYRRIVTSTLNTIECSAISNCITVLINNVSGGSIDQDQTICSGGDPAAFTVAVAATGSGALSYQWQSSTTDCVAGYGDIPGATDATYDVPSGLTDTTYYRRITTSTLNSVQCSATSNCATILINNVSAGVVGEDQTICSGDDPDAFTVVSPATGSGALTYQWQSSTTDCVSDFADIAGATNETYDVPSGLTDTTYYRRIVTSTLNSITCSSTGNCISVWINNVSAGLVGSDQTICSGGDPAVFSVVTPAVGSGSLTYQWQSSTTDCASDFVDIGGATDATYDAPAGLTDTTYYRRIVTSTLNGKTCTATSNCITVLINNIDAGILGSDQTICLGGDPVEFTALTPASGSGILTYQWQSSTTDCVSGFADIAGATDETYDVTSGLTDTTYYRRIVTSSLNSVECSATSNCITVLINNVSAGDVGMDQTICSGGDPDIFMVNVAATGSGVLTYQWQSSITDCVSGFIDIDGATDATYDAPAGLVDTTYYRRIVTSSLNSIACSAISNCITVLINNVSPGEIEADQTICSGGDPDIFTVTVAATGSGAITYQWQSSTTDCFNGFADITGATDATYDAPSGLVDTTYYRRITTSSLNGVDCSLASNCVTVLVNNISAGIVDADQTICAGGDPEVFSVSTPAVGSGVLTYQWQSSTTDCISDFTDISGATDATYDAPAGLIDTTYYRRIVTSTLNSISCSATSNCITVLINNVYEGNVGTDQTVCASGDPEVFTEEDPADGSGVLTYQWQSSTTDCVSGFADIAGATNPTYDAPSGIVDTTYYRRIVTSTLNGVTCDGISNCVTILINNIDPGTIQAEQTICSGGDPEVFTQGTAAVGSGAVSYQWQSSTTDCSSGFTDIAGATDLTYDAPTGVTDTTYYRRIATSTLNAIECSVASNCVTVFINDISAGVIDSDQTICFGGDPDAFSAPVSATGSGALTYQWQSSTTDCITGFADIAGATDETYDPPSGLTDTTYYRRIVTSTLNSVTCSAISNCVTVLINNVSAGNVGSDQTICASGDPEAFTVVVSASGSGALSYQWQSSTTDCTNGFSDIAGATDETYDAPAGVTDTTYYRRITTSTLNSVACSAISNCITILINNVDPGILGSDQTICSGGDPAPFTIINSENGSGVLTYQWQSSTTDCTSGYSDIAGATDALYDAPSGLTDTTYYRRIVTSTLNSVACSALSNCITVLINNVSGGVIEADQTICFAGDPDGFTDVIPAAGSGLLTYQWQSSTTDCVNDFVDIGGATNALYDVPGGLTLTTHYRRITTSTLNSVTCDAVSNCATIDVNEAVSYGVVEDADEALCSGEDPMAIFFEEMPTGGTNNFTFQWYYREGIVPCPSGTDVSGWTMIPLATNDSYDPPGNLMSSRTYAVMVDPVGVQNCGDPTWASGCRQVLVYGTIIMSGPVSGPSVVTVCDGGNPDILTASPPSGGDGNYSYQWQQSVGCSIVWQPAVAEDGLSNGLTFDPPVLSLPDTSICYRLRITDGCGRIGYSSVKRHDIMPDPVSPTINPVPAAGTTICLGESVSATFNTGSGGTGEIVDTFELSINGGNDWMPYIPGTPVTATPAMTGAGTIIIRSQRLASGNGCNDGAYEMVEWSVDNIQPVIAVCPVMRNVSGCDLSALTGPIFNTTLTSSDYTVFSDLTNNGNASDNCAITEVAYQDVASGSCPIVVTRTWTLRDSAGNVTSCDQTILITSPAVMIECAEDVDLPSCMLQMEINNAFDAWKNALDTTISGGCNPTAQYWVNGSAVNLAEVEAPDQCAGGAVTVYVSYSDQCEAGDSVCVSTFTVEPVAPVVVDCPADIVMPSCMTQTVIDSTFEEWLTALDTAVSGGCNPAVTFMSNAVPVLLSELQAPDQCTGGSVTVSIGYNDLCESGSTVCVSTFSVTPAPAVVLTCPAPVDLGTCNTVQFVADTFALWKAEIASAVSGGCSPDIVYEVDGQQIALEDLFPPDNCGGGTLTLILSYTDLCEMSSCTTSFSVAPTPPVMISCPEDVVIASCTPQNTIDQAFTDWVLALEASVSGGCAPQAQYIVNGDTLSSLAGVAAPDMCAGGIIEIERRYTDICGTGGCTSTFTVPADESPEMTGLPNDQTYQTTSTGCQRTIPILKPGISDSCDPNPVMTLASDDPGVEFFDLGTYWLADFPQGVTEITITGTDQCGNATIHVFTITVNDAYAPVITGCPTNKMIYAEDECGKQVYWLPPTASDNCPGVALTGTHLPGDYFPVGMSTVSYTATDAGGLMSTCSFTVVVLDTLSPVFDCGSLFAINLVPNGPPDCTNDTDIPVPVAMDNCGMIQAVGVRSDGRPLNDPWFDGTMVTVTWTFTDPSGNETVCTQDVHVASCIWPTPYIYVDASKSTGDQTGVDWDNALLRIEDALFLAENYPVIQEIWVAEGTYRPTPASGRNISFELISNVRIMGGFAGVVEDMSDRDLQQFNTILSGDVGIFNNHTDNSYHVVHAGPEVVNAVLDGCTIARGQADGPDNTSKRGAAIRCEGQVELIDCLLETNVGLLDGGVISVTGSQAELTIENCTLQNNQSPGSTHLRGDGNATTILKGNNQIQD